MTAAALETSALPLWQAALVLAPGALAALAALHAAHGRPVASAWRGARWAAGAGLGLALLSLLAVVRGAQGVAWGLRADPLGAVVTLLVAFVGWVIVRYSEPYLNGEAQERHYVRWLMATLAAVGVVLASDNLLLLALAWMATSLALHRLLTFFSERAPAIVAAHKKFIVGRAADVCMIGAAALFAAAFGSLSIERIVAQAAALPALPASAQAAVLLVALAALLKCAQLPFHGWLIQVMEAPTPVCALLHAGIVNLGGFVLMRIAPLLPGTPAAEALLVAVGAATAVLASLVMITRISIKVMLAWSTCAQMGFMLMQCGLGVWEMALLHLLAHSLYKAHAFLGAGGAVRGAMLVQLTPRAAKPGAAALAFGVVAAAAMTLAAGAAWSALSATLVAPPTVWVLAMIVAFALVPMLHGQSLRLGGWWLPALWLGAFALAMTYFMLHGLLGRGWTTSVAPAPWPLWAAVALAFAVLLLLQCWITVAPQGALACRLYPWFYGGLFLDETFTRWAFTLWRPRVPAALPTPDGARAGASGVPA